MADIQSRRVWSLSSGKLIDECDVGDVPDMMLHRPLPQADDIRVELVLKNALALYERVGPDVSKIFSQPRICSEAAGRRFAGETLSPGWSLDLTILDPATGQRWDLSKPSVQSRVKKLVRDTQPFCVIGSPPCTPFSPLQEISRAKRDARVMEDELNRGKVHMRFCFDIYRMQLAAKRHFMHEQRRPAIRRAAAMGMWAQLIHFLHSPSRRAKHGERTRVNSRWRAWCGSHHRRISVAITLR